MRRNYQGFTLIELLVVISIIALLIGILLPALGVARETARSNVCLSNSRQMGLAINQYGTEFGGAFPDHYYYKTSSSFSQAYPGDWKNMADLEDPDGGGSAPSGPSLGYVQWSGTLIGLGYLNDSKGLVCPSSATGGWAPTFYDDTPVQGNTNGFGSIVDKEGIRQASSNRPAYSENGISFGGATATAAAVPAMPGAYNAQIDAQASRLSYVGNEAFMPRGKYRAVYDGTGVGQAGKSNAAWAKLDQVEKAAGSIIIAEYTDSARQVYDTSSSSGNGLKVHRPTHAVVTAASSGLPSKRYDGENWLYNAGTGGAGSKIAGDVVQALPTDAFTTIVTAFKNNPTQTNQNIAMPAFSGGAANVRPFLAYVGADRHSGQANYTFADGHAALKKVEDTLNPTDWQWGLRMYSNAERPQVFQPGSTTIPVY